MPDSQECRSRFMTLYNKAAWLREQGTVRVVNIIEEQELYKVKAKGSVSEPPRTSLESLAEDPAMPQDIRHEASKLLADLRTMLKPIQYPQGHYGIGHIPISESPIRDLNRFYDNTAETLISRAFEEYLACACGERKGR